MACDCMIKTDKKPCNTAGNLTAAVSGIDVPPLLY